MNKRRVIQITACSMIIALVLQAGVFAYSKVAGTENSKTANPAKSMKTTDKLQEIAKVTASSGDIPAQVSTAQAVQNAQPLQSEVVHVSYQQFLNAFDVQDVYREKLKQLAASGYSRGDICTAYDFLYQNFGSEADLEAMLASKSSGKTWEQIFTAFTAEQPKFEPRAFDSDELENLMKAQSLTSDDIMIGDHLSFVTGKPFKDLIGERIETGDWGAIFAREKVLYSGKSLPRVQITQEELHQYTQQGTFSEQQVVKAFVLAQKVGEAPEVVVAKLKEGTSEAAIMADSYLKKYAE
ncbi:hypothetical protein [Paenibacillus sp. MMS20-IR301]|uniref:hypothetical protein n=1 Tax=Paenibacillus sp. MMS20-IR301 TaxID=2895946 RepID=UPI0028EDF7E1|nr:hypothetical protein [Paenibacillus sp. MMS20-IR301]WNS43266.1 hypothetical protein LOS79_30735 [Paenibacillus sp. MMS20-IR301]